MAWPVTPHPFQDLVIPAHRPKEHYRSSPLMGKAPVARDILLFFRVSGYMHNYVHIHDDDRQVGMRYLKNISQLPDSSLRLAFCRVFLRTDTCLHLMI